MEVLNLKSKFMSVLIATTITSTTLLTPIGSFASATNSMPSDLNNLHQGSKQAIEELYEKGLLGGYEDGTFRPKDEVTRAEFAAMLVRVLGLTSSGSALKFSDTKEGVWHYDTMNIAYENGLMSGVGEDELGRPIMKPNDTVTRLEMMLILVRVHENFNQSIDVNEEEQILYENKFEDWKYLPVWAELDVAKAIKANITSGIATDTLGFKEKGNREQSAIFAHRTLKEKETQSVDLANQMKQEIIEMFGSEEIYQKHKNNFQFTKALENHSSLGFTAEYSENEQLQAEVEEKINLEIEKLNSAEIYAKIVSYISEHEQELKTNIETLATELENSINSDETLTEEEKSLEMFGMSFGLIGMSAIELHFKGAEIPEIQNSAKDIINILLKNEDFRALYKEYAAMAVKNNNVTEYEKNVIKTIGVELVEKIVEKEGTLIGEFILNPESTPVEDDAVSSTQIIDIPEDATYYNIGETVYSSYNRFEYTATGVSTDNQVTWYDDFLNRNETFTASEDKKLLKIDIIANNTNEHSNSLYDASDFTLIDSNNISYEYPSGMDYADEPFLATSWNFVDFGQEKAGTLVFEVPMDANGFKLRVRQVSNPYFTLIDLGQ